MGPTFFSPQSNLDGLGTSGWFFDELKDTDRHVLASYMWLSREMFADALVSSRYLYVSKMVDKTVFESQHRLAYILHATPLACDGIYQVGTSA